VPRLLYSSFKGNQFTRKGLREERATIVEYVHFKKQQDGTRVTVKESGLHVDGSVTRWSCCAVR
jgi:hypothetical protein